MPLTIATSAPLATGLLAFLFGLVLGSFLNVAIYRLPRGISLATPRSRCPHCGRPIRAWENIPLLSYVFLLGRCRGCRRPISLRYPLIELCTGLLFWWGALLYGPVPGFLRFTFFTVSMLALVMTDWDCQQLPDEITLGGIVVGLGLAAAVQSGGAWGWSPHHLELALLGALTGAGMLWLVGELYFRVRGREGMGLGDVKMMGMVGSFLGWQMTLLTVLLASLTGVAVGIVLMLTLGVTRVRRWRRRNFSWTESCARASSAVQVYFSRRAIPFGVFLGTMAVVSWQWGPSLWAWYMSAFGVAPR